MVTDSGTTPKPRRGAPTVFKLRLAVSLRRIREQRQLKIAEAAALMDRDQSWLSRLENGDIRVQLDDLENLLLRVYKLPAPEVEQVLAVGKRARERGWWFRYRDSLPSWFQDFVGIETVATKQRLWQPHSVPGILQTREYAEALVSRSREKTAEQVGAVVELRMERQAVLSGADPQELVVVLDQSALLRRIGGVDVLHAQVERLAELATWPNITIHVLPLDAPVAVDGNMILFDLPPASETTAIAGYEQIAYVGTVTRALYITDSRETREYSDAFGDLRSEALGTEQSAELLRKGV